MIETLKDMAIALILAGLCAIGAYILKMQKQHILTVITDLIQRAEDAIQGSKMGQTKKAVVIAQLEAMGIKVTGWLDEQIDYIVAYLNLTAGWLTDKAAVPETKSETVTTEE